MNRTSLFLGFTAIALLSGSARSQQPSGGGGGRGPGGQGVEIKPGEECPAGMTEIRPRRCMAPEATPPSILDYRPKSTLVALSFQQGRFQPSRRAAPFTSGADGSAPIFSRSQTAHAVSPSFFSKRLSSSPAPDRR